MAYPAHHHATCTTAPDVPPPAPTCMRAAQPSACHVPRVTGPTRLWPLPPGPPPWEGSSPCPRRLQGPWRPQADPGGRSGAASTGGQDLTGGHV